jgi:flagellar hook-associated protein 1
MVAVNPLNIALTGLKVAQAQMSITANNVSNASTNGYTRKTAQNYTPIIGGEPAGVEIGIVQRSVNETLIRDYRAQVSSASALSTKLNYLDQVQDFHGPPDSEQSITAYLGKLKDSFVDLSNQPESGFLLNEVVSKAQQVVDKFSDFSKKITNMRNDAQTEISESVKSINALSKQIATLNIAIKDTKIRGQSTADLEDQRDIAIKSMASEIDLSYFLNQDGVLTVMTREGQLIADTQAVPVNFIKSSIIPTSYYPATVNSIRLGNPTTGVDLTTVSSLGGRMGALVELRDKTLPTYQAQMDETAHKMALRFNAEGLKLFTTPDGSIPANTASSYVGFAEDMVVNPDIIKDTSLIRKGTSSTSTLQDGSAELLRKIVQFTFGDVQYQQSRSSVDVSNTVPTLFTTLGISGQSKVVGTTNIQGLGALDTSSSINPPAQGDFTIQVGAGAPQTITITAGMTAAGLTAAINTTFPNMAKLGSGGELILTSNNTLTIGGGSLGSAGLAALGLTAGATSATAPSFTIAAGKNTPTTITIASTDTVTQLLSNLNAVPGITATLTSGGFLNIVPTEGGDITLRDGTGAPLSALGMVQTDVLHTAFNTVNLGSSGTISGEVQSATTLQNYMTQAISLQSQDATNAKTLFLSEDNYRAVIEKEYLNDSGVNIDEEMTKLVSIQAAYTASARTLKVVQDMLDELFNTFR